MDKGIEALIAALKLAMKSATPGQWSFARSGANMNVQAPVNLQRGGAAKVVMCSLKSSQWRNQLATAHDAAFIALANPENIKQLIASLEQAQQEYQAIEQKLIKAAVYIETLESEPRKTNLKQLNEIAGLNRKCEELETASVKPVNMPDAYAIRPGHPINENERSVMIPKDGGNWYSRLDIEHALRVAGVRFEGGE